MTELTEEAITKAFLTSLHHAGEHQHPYRHWLLDHCLPEEMVDTLIALPFTPPQIEDTKGRRETNNDSRIHFGPQYRNQHRKWTRSPACSIRGKWRMR